MITIPQGRSSQKPYFLVADPEPPRVTIGQEVLCVNPRTGEKTKGTVVDRWSFHWEKNPMGGLIRLEYGVAYPVLRAALEALDEAFKNPYCSLLTIKEIR